MVCQYLTNNKNENNSINFKRNLSVEHFTLVRASAVIYSCPCNYLQIKLALMATYAVAFLFTIKIMMDSAIVFKAYDSSYSSNLLVYPTLGT